MSDFVAEEALQPHQRGRRPGISQEQYGVIGVDPDNQHAEQEGKPVYFISECFLCHGNRTSLSVLILILFYHTRKRTGNIFSIIHTANLQTVTVSSQPGTLPSGLTLLSKKEEAAEFIPVSLSLLYEEVLFQSTRNPFTA